MLIHSRDSAHDLKLAHVYVMTKYELYYSVLYAHLGYQTST